ncbi:MAG TPA: hypothetical protein PLV92_11485, partial [Pirellulaceae bacterium]|nr:hypothetical protein [Pirellulaceae bacterium]
MQRPSFALTVLLASLASCLLLANVAQCEIVVVFRDGIEESAAAPAAAPLDPAPADANQPPAVAAAAAPVEPAVATP